MKTKPLPQSDTAWRKQLGEEQYHILREKGTEPAFSGALLHNKADGYYACEGCGSRLFSSKQKYDSGSGWPSFWDALEKEALLLVEDASHGMVRTEVVCATCKGHLGHLFDDGPEETTGLRYCINSAALRFEKKA